MNSCDRVFKHLHYFLFYLYENCVAREYQSLSLLHCILTVFFFLNTMMNIFSRSCVIPRCVWNFICAREECRSDLRTNSLFKEISDVVCQVRSRSICEREIIETSAWVNNFTDFICNRCEQKSSFHLVRVYTLLSLLRLFNVT